MRLIERPACQPSRLPFLNPAQYAENAASGGKVIAHNKLSAFSSSMIAPESIHKGL